MGITQKDFARQQGVSPARVNQWLRDGIVSRESILPDGSLDPVAASRDVLKNRDPSKRLEYEIRRAESNHSPEVEDYLVVKAFIQEIDGEEFRIPRGTILRVYGRKGSSRIEIAFFPGKK
jgi:transcriptional regulator with XRE-family HTH domain